jgi:hypothetical protein
MIAEAPIPHSYQSEKFKDCLAGMDPKNCLTNILIKSDNANRRTNTIISRRHPQWHLYHLGHCEPGDVNATWLHNP